MNKKIYLYIIGLFILLGSILLFVLTRTPQGTQVPSSGTIPSSTTTPSGGTMPSGTTIPSGSTMPTGSKAPPKKQTQKNIYDAVDASVKQFLNK